MKCYNLLFKLFNIIFILYIHFMGVMPVQAADEQDQNQLKANRKQALELVSANKNAQALEILERTGKIQDKIYTLQRDSVADKIKSDFVKNKQSRQSEISRKQNEIKELRSGNEDIDRENFKMIRSTLFFFGTLVGFAVLLLLNRFRKLSQLKTQLIASETQLAETEKIISSGKNYEVKAKNWLSGWNEVVKNTTEAGPLLVKISSDKQHPLHKQVMQLQESTITGLSLLADDTDLEPLEKRPVDLNMIIEEVVNQAYYYTSHEYTDFNCTVIKDLEKILPKVDLIPSDIRFVMFNLLINAFDAVRQKRTNAPKGYEPKVTISTRKLPRFVQIRVRDNGIGITEKDPQQVFEPFYSSKAVAKHTGLGLAESKKIITTTYKGELFIESDFTTGTDFIIRFPVLTLM